MSPIVEALYTSAGMLWKALWALSFGYMISAAIQVLVTREQMGRALGDRGLKQGALAGVFGFVSSSCSFAALAASRSIFVKGAHPSNGIAFLIAATNLVIELGIVLLVLLSWHFVVGNFLLGLLMIIYTYALTRVWMPDGWARQAREHAEEMEAAEMEGESAVPGDWKEKLTSFAGWHGIARAYVREWKMVWKEILFGFTVAGLISVLVPDSVWHSLFFEAGSEAPSVVAVVQNAAIAPVIAFFTFIGSMGNVPLAAMLWSKEASFGGVMAFLGADLVAATVIYIHYKYYGWRYTTYLSVLLYIAMVGAGITVHYVMSLLGGLPTGRPTLQEMVAFEVDYTFWFNIVFVSAGLFLLVLAHRGRGSPEVAAEEAR